MCENVKVLRRVQALFSKSALSAKEKQDVDDLEVEDTKKLFLEQGTWEAKQKKEMQEYLDAKNKEVIVIPPG